MRVLIADFDRSRAGRHTEACAARGYVVDRVEHGAAALGAEVVDVFGDGVGAQYVQPAGQALLDL